MVGHGCPREGPQAFADHCQPGYVDRTRLARFWLFFCALFPLAILCVVRDLPAAELDLRLRVTWGGGEPRPWRGTMTAQGGKLVSPRSLGTQANVAEEFIVEQDTIQFSHATASSWSGMDVQVVGTEQTVLLLEVVPADRPEPGRTVEIKLSEFVPAAKVVHAEPLDDRGNSISIERAPGDRLRVEWDRDSLVFSPGESFPFTVRPHALGLPAGTVLRCTLQLQPAGSQEVLWKDSHDIRLDAVGQTGPIGPLKLAIPGAEGVYEIVISLVQRRFADNLVPGTLGNLVPSRQLMVRKVQFLVLSDQRQPVPPAEWKLVEEIDLANPKWWERFSWLPHWKVLPGTQARGPLGDRVLIASDFLGQKVYELGASGWHAAPIPIRDVGRPHLVEVEYPNDRRQTLGISVVEPDAAGELRSGGVDSGVDVAAHPKPATPAMETHRLVFWPHSSTPWLLLTNRRDDAPAAFGRIRVYAGPVQLPALELTAVDGQRILAAHFDKPLFTENFGAAESLDPVAKASYQDWQTFYQGGQRLAEYLKYAGYNAAIVPVLCDGGSLYPSDRVRTTPKYDNGVMFQSGQDPVQKDVLEMLLRIFDREGLLLIPSIQFSSPLPELEAELRSGQNHLGGLSMIGFFPGEQKARLGRDDSRLGAAPLYNPLDSRVQTAMRQVAAEVLDRCKPHKSFAGLAVQLSPHSYSVLPDDAWCLDDATFSRFSQATAIPDATDADRLNRRLQRIRGAAREPWLQWRAAELTRFYRDLQLDVRRSRGDARLFLTTTDLVGGRVLHAALRPSLPARADIADAMLRHGLDAAGLAHTANALLLRPRGIAVTGQLAAYASRIELAQSEAVDNYFRAAAQTSSIAVNDPLPQKLPGFDEVSPFGPEKTATELLAQIVPGGVNSRAHLVRSLAALDSPFVADGGWQLSLGQSESQQRFARVFRQLPARPFTTVPLPSDSGAAPIALRTLQVPGRTYLYLANPTALSAAVQVTLETPTASVARALDGRSPPTLPRKGGSAVWSVDLEPFDVAAIECSTDDVRVAQWNTQFDRDSVAVLGGLLQDLRVRLEQLNRFQPTQLFANANFEQPNENGQIPGWSFAANPGVSVDLDPAVPQEGTKSLHMRVEGEKTIGWLRSAPFAIPKTGRVTVQAWIRTRSGGPQPPVRMSIDGQLPYRWWSLGVDVDGRSFQPTGRPVLPVPDEWSAAPFLIHMADLPPSITGEVSLVFELRGPGEIWIDSVQVSDVYFEPAEYNELRKAVFNAQLQLQRGELADCQQFLQGYWPRFVLEFVPPPRLTQVPQFPPRESDPQPSPPEEKPSRWKWPSIPLKVPFK